MIISREAIRKAVKNDREKVRSLSPLVQYPHQSEWNFPLRVVFYEETTPSYRW
jgi:hypothetical protein